MGQRTIPQRTYLFNRDTDTLSCGTAGDIECTDAHFVSARVSSFHTENLQKATVQINGIFQALQEDPDRPEHTHLEILVTPAGLFLAWAHHDAVTGHDDDNTIMEALRIEG